MYLVLEKQVEGIKRTAIDGKALIRNQEKLDLIATARSLPSLTSFLSFNPEELIRWAESVGASAEGIDIPPEQWFSASELLTTIMR